MSSGQAWRPWEDVLVRELFAQWPADHIASLLQIRTAKAVKSRAKVLGVRKGLRQLWTPEQDALLRSLYPHKPTTEVAERCGHSLASTYRRAVAILGLRKTAEYLASPDACRLRRGDNVGAACRFQKGHVPANKGTKRPGWAPGRMAQTQFKKGQISGRAAQRVCPVGTVKFNGDGYLVRKIGDKVNNGVGAKSRNWEFVHRRTWEDAKGPIPPGHRIWCKDSNHANCALDNLELLSDAEHMARTTIQNLPPELKQVIQLTGALKRKIRNRKEKLNAKEQSGGPPQSSVRDAGVTERLRA